MMKNIVGDAVTLVSLVMVVVGVMIAVQNPPSFLKTPQLPPATLIRSVYTPPPTAAATLQVAAATRAPTAAPPTQAPTITRQPTAQPTPLPTPSPSQIVAPKPPTADSSALPVFGPAEGTIQPDREQSCSNVPLGDFTAQVEFTNPNDAPEIPNAGYGFQYFRDNGNYQTWVNWSDGLLAHVAHTESGSTGEAHFLGGPDFRFSGMNKGKGAVNRINIRVKGDNAQLVVNDIPGPMIDLSLENSRSSNTTKVCPCLCNFVPKSVMQFLGMKTDQITEQALFRNFTVRRLP